MAAGNKITWEIGLYNPDTYYIYRSDSPMDPNNLPTPIATLGTGVSEYLDTDNIVEGNTYYYRVDAEKKGLYIPGYETRYKAKAIYVYAAGKYVRRYDPEYNQLDQTIANNYGLDITVNPNDRFAHLEDYDRIYGFNENGFLAWNTGYNRELLCISYDNDRYIYAGCRNGYILKIDANNGGNTNINRQHGYKDFTSIKFNRVDGYIYAGTSEGEIKKFNTIGYEESLGPWPITYDRKQNSTDNEIKAVDCDGYGYIYYATKNGRIRKLDSEGNKLLYQNGGNPLIHMAVNEEGDFAHSFTSFTRNGDVTNYGYINFRKKDGSLVWSNQETEINNSFYKGYNNLAVDINKNVYAYYDSERLFIFNKDGNIIENIYQVNDGQVGAVAVTPVLFD